MRCLIIDDSKPVRGILSKMMEDLGIKSVEAEDGAQGLDRLRQYPDIELAWVDWNMPVMDGMEFAKAVRGNPIYNSIRLVMVTTESDLVHIQAAMKVGVDDYVTKPFTKEDIDDKLALQGLHPYRRRPESNTVPAKTTPAAPIQTKAPPSKFSVPTPDPTVNPIATGEQIRVLIVDDSLVVRSIMKKVLSEDPEIDVVDVASDGQVAMQKIALSHPDVVLLDIEMPNMNGFETIKAIRAQHGGLPVVMFSSLTQSGSRATIDALVLGADDYVHKPGGAQMSDSVSGQQRIREEVIPKVKQFGKRGKTLAKIRVNKRTKTNAQPEIEIIAIGVSTGGPQALADFLPKFVPGLTVPVLIVQHMPPVFTAHLAERLSATGSIPVREAREGERPMPGHVYIAPGGYHLTVSRETVGMYLRMNQDPPEHACRPAVDPLFRSLANHYATSTLAVVLTGMGRDGLAGAKTLVDAGGAVLAQDETSSVIWGMPGQVVKANLAEEVLNLHDLALEIKRRVKRTMRPPLD